jgi:hypothetical protein
VKTRKESFGKIPQRCRLINTFRPPYKHEQGYFGCREKKFSIFRNKDAKYFLTMRFFLPATTILCSIIICAVLPGFSQDGPPGTVFGRPAVFIGPVVAYSARNGYIDISDIRRSVAVPRGAFAAFGLEAGMESPLSKALRLQTGLYLDVGSAVDDTLFTAETVTVRNFYYHAGMEPQLHISPWHSSRVAPFVSFGAGAHCVWVQERTFLLRNPSQEILYTDRKYVGNASFSFSLVSGLGCDIALGKRLGISLSDFFRYLYPVSYSINQDFPLYEMPYHESQYGNVFCLGITVRLR